MLTIKLDTVRKQRNAQEWRDVPRARLGTIESISEQHPICECARAAIEAGLASAGMVTVERYGRPVFPPYSLGFWASLAVTEGRARGFRRYREREAAE